MKVFIVSILSFLFLYSNSMAQDKNTGLPDVIQLTINNYGLAKSSSSIHTSYSIENYKLHYDYNFNGSMGRNSENMEANKKFAHRMLRELNHFLEEAGEALKNKEHNFDSDDTDRIIEVNFSYLLNGEKISWSMKGGESIVEKHADYKKILEL